MAEDTDTKSQDRSKRLDNLDLLWGRLWTTNAAKAMSDRREWLIELDRQIGDADHGENMDRGFAAIMRGGGVDNANSVSELLKYNARTLLSTVGGAAGPLYGTAFMWAARAYTDGDTSSQNVVAILEAAALGVQSIGKAVRGEKTMVDAMVPAAEAAKASADNGKGIVEVLRAAAFGAKAGVQATKPMRAQKGRSAYLGERSRGHIDPGAASVALILQAASDAADTVFGGE